MFESQRRITLGSSPSSYQLDLEASIYTGNKTSKKLLQFWLGSPAHLNILISKYLHHITDLPLRVSNENFKIADISL